MTPEEELRADAERRYHYDAVFHAWVEAAVGMIEASIRPARLDRHDRSLATHAASLALAVASHSPDGRGL